MTCFSQLTILLNFKASLGREFMFSPKSIIRTRALPSLWLAQISHHAMATAEIALSQEFSKEKLSWEIPFPFSDTVFGGPAYPAVLTISIFIFKIISNFRVEKMAHHLRALLQRTWVLFLALAWWFTTTRLQF